MKRVLIVGSQHGNEVLGLDLYRYIIEHHPGLEESISYLCANPEAFAQGVRYTESDLNRSFNVSTPKTYEEKRAQQLQSDIDSGNYDYVLDMHTTTAESEDCIITASIDGLQKEIIHSSPIDKIVVMPPHIVAHSLIGNIKNSISLEFNESKAKEPETLNELADFLRKLCNSTATEAIERHIFYVERLIQPHELDADEAVNFTLTKSGIYPVLAGEKNYVGYNGFAAMQKDTVSM